MSDETLLPSMNEDHTSTEAQPSAEGHSSTSEEQSPILSESQPTESSASDHSTASDPAKDGGSKEERTQRSSNNKRKFNKPRAPQQPRKEIGRFIAIGWSGQREPADDLYWCEIERNGQWLTVSAMEQVRTRREILERLLELQDGVVAFDFSFSFPRPFMEYLKEQDGIDGWRAMIHRVREDLKKNSEDGVRLWVERMGTYRESNLDPNWQPRRRPNFDSRNNRGGRQQQPQKLAPHDQRSLTERFRRTEHAIRRVAENHITSALQINYNRLTSRYEFGDPRMHGRASLMGMSFLDQLLDQKEGLAVWPWAKQDKLTIVEMRPWVFTRGKLMSSEECRAFLAVEEDHGLDLDPAYRDLICRQPKAQEVFRSALGMIRAETREERTVRPLRDYPQEFYEDDRIKDEGWIYGIGYKSAEQRSNEQKAASQKQHPRQQGQQQKKNAGKQNTVVGSDTSLSQDLENAASVPVPSTASYEQAVSETTEQPTTSIEAPSIESSSVETPSTENTAS